MAETLGRNLWRHDRRSKRFEPLQRGPREVLKQVLAPTGHRCGYQCLEHPERRRGPLGIAVVAPTVELRHGIEEAKRDTEYGVHSDPPAAAFLASAAAFLAAAFTAAF